MGNGILHPGADFCCCLGGTGLLSGGFLLFFLLRYVILNTPRGAEYSIQPEGGA